MVPRFLSLLLLISTSLSAALPLFWWKPTEGSNFGDELSEAIVSRMSGAAVERACVVEKKLLALGSILQFARDDDVVWGSGINGNSKQPIDLRFTKLDVRAVRGPLTRKVLLRKGIEVPEVYGDPALLLPDVFPEFRRPKKPTLDYVIVPHISEMELFRGERNVILPTEPWDEVVRRILSARLVISSSLHGIVVAEAFGVPARLLRLTNNEHLFKYTDYYRGTGRSHASYASSVEEALRLGGEVPAQFDRQRLLDAFPSELM